MNKTPHPSVAIGKTYTCCCKANVYAYHIAYKQQRTSSLLTYENIVTHYNLRLAVIFIYLIGTHKTLSVQGNDGEADNR